MGGVELVNLVNASGRSKNSVRWALVPITRLASSNFVKRNLNRVLNKLTICPCSTVSWNLQK